MIAMRISIPLVQAGNDSMERGELENCGGDRLTGVRDIVDIPALLGLRRAKLPPKWVG